LAWKLGVYVSVAVEVTDADAVSLISPPFIRGREPSLPSFNHSSLSACMLANTASKSPSLSKSPSATWNEGVLPQLPPSTKSVLVGEPSDVS